MFCFAISKQHFSYGQSPFHTLHFRTPNDEEFGVNERDKARLAGQTTYNSGKPCARGHIGDRYVTSGNCIACLALRRAVRHNLEAGNKVLEFPMHRDLAPEFIEFATLIMRRDPAALTHMRLAIGAHTQPVPPLGAG